MWLHDRVSVLVCSADC